MFLNAKLFVFSGLKVKNLYCLIREDNSLVVVGVLYLYSKIIVMGHENSNFMNIYLHAAIQ